MPLRQKNEVVGTGCTAPKTPPRVSRTHSHECEVCGFDPLHCICKESDKEEDVLDCQSGTNMFNVTITPGMSDETSQITQFKDQNPAWDYSVVSEPDPTYGQADMGDVALGDFFSRPLRIKTINWATTDASFYETFDPWNLFFSDPRILNRISNFNLLRCKLKLKFVINGNGFHYGRLLAAYLPLHLNDDFTVDRGFISQDLVQASQRPHIYLDPTTSMGGTMTLPFFWYANALSVPEAEWSEMGRIDIHPLQLLKHANGATDQVTISVFAWAEDVVLSAPTVAEPAGLVPQSGEIFDCQSGDEYGTGPISRPASLIARATGALSSAPMIGLYAKATSMAASTIAGVATMFGFSRPAIITDITPYRPVYVGNMANSNVPDSTTRLSLDVKQEVTVDPRTTGLAGVDEMTVKSIACRESYLTQYAWAVADAPDDRLFNIRVTPVLWAENVNGTNTEIHMPACCYAALPFRNWRGRMKFRFQVVSSNYHKGRLRIVYDPYTSENNEFNTAYNRIIDIAEEKDFTVEIGWGSKFPFCTHQDPGRDAIPYDTLPLPALTRASESNGVLSVYVLNELTVPNSSVDNDIQVNVFVSACDDFEVANPASIYIDELSWFPTPPPVIREPILPTVDEVLDSQSGEEMAPPDAECTEEPSKPMATDTTFDIAATLDDTDGMMDICFGEKITSFRQCLKRYGLHTVYGIPSGTTGTFLYSRVSGNMPYYRGYAGTGAVHSVGATPYNRARMTLLNYMVPAFTGWRGALRWKTQAFMNQDTTTLNNQQSFMTVMREGEDTTNYAETADQWIFADNANFIASEHVRKLTHGWDGQTNTSIRQNPVLEYECPWYANIRFFPAKQKNLTSTSSFVAFKKFQALVNRESTGGVGANFLDYVSVGEDFNLFFFTGCPIAYFAPSDPDP